MYKICISGKANSGKDTVASLLYKEFNGPDNLDNFVKIALADPIKEIIMTMFPDTEKDILYGPSKNRSNIIPNSFKNGKPLTYRQLLQDIGTEVGRSYNENIWLDIASFKEKQAQKDGCGMFVVGDVRFRNEFNFFRDRLYLMIRVVRNNCSNMTHASEVEQELIQNNEFDYIIENNGTLEDLQNKIHQIWQSLPKQEKPTGYVFKNSLDEVKITKEIVSVFNLKGKDEFYKYLVSSCEHEVALVKNGTYKGISPEIDLLNQYNKFMALYRRDYNELYLNIAKVFRRASHKIYSAMLKDKLIEKNKMFLNLV